MEIIQGTLHYLQQQLDIQDQIPQQNQFQPQNHCEYQDPYNLYDKSNFYDYGYSGQRAYLDQSYGNPNNFSYQYYREYNQCEFNYAPQQHQYQAWHEDYREEGNYVPQFENHPEYNLNVEEQRREEEQDSIEEPMKELKDLWENTKKLFNQDMASEQDSASMQ